jgi:S-adenosylmethionine:tRNA-ribosyltransferase-isomerase (queuine synthetase)
MAVASEASAIASVSAARVLAVENGALARASSVNAFKSDLEDKLLSETTARNGDRTYLLSMITGEQSARKANFNALSNEITNIDSNISQIVATEVINQQYDFSQQEAIRAVCNKLQMTDSQLYANIAPKSAIYAVKVGFRAFLHDIISAFTLTKNGMSLSVSDYVPANTVIPAATVPTANP